MSARPRVFIAVTFPHVARRSGLPGGDSVALPSPSSSCRSSKAKTSAKRSGKSSTNAKASRRSAARRPFPARARSTRTRVRARAPAAGSHAGPAGVTSPVRAVGTETASRPGAGAVSDRTARRRPGLGRGDGAVRPETSGWSGSMWTGGSQALSPRPRPRVPWAPRCLTDAASAPWLQGPACCDLTEVSACRGGESGLRELDQQSPGE